jgi:hypothetical protein
VYAQRWCARLYERLYLLLIMFGLVYIGVNVFIADATAEVAQSVAKKESGVLPCTR